MRMRGSSQGDSLLEYLRLFTEVNAASELGVPRREVVDPLAPRLSGERDGERGGF